MDNTLTSPLTMLTCAAFHSAAVMCVPITTVQDERIFVAPTEHAQWAVSVSTNSVESAETSWLTQEADFWSSESEQLDTLMSEISEEITSALSSTVTIDTTDDALAWAAALVKSANL